MSIESTGYVVICAAVGLSLVVYSLHQRRRLRASESWPQTAGSILKTELAIDNSGESTEYRPEVLYEYTVDGVRYTGRQIELNRRSYVRRRTAQSRLDKYQIGSSMMVYFNPERPQDAVLERTAPYSTLYLVTGLLLAGLAAGIAIFSGWI